MIQFESPLWFLALVPLVPFLTYCAHKSYADLQRRRSLQALALRLVGLALVVLGLTRPVLLLENSERVVLYLIDVSESAPTASLESAWQELSAHAAARDDGESVGVVLFAGHPRLVVAPTAGELTLTDALRRKLFHQREKRALEERVGWLERNELDATQQAELDEARAHLAEIGAWCADLGTDETDLEAACRLARGLLPVEARRRIVVVSDGLESRGELVPELAELARAGISAHARLLPHDEQPEVVAEDVFLPVEAQVKAPFTVEFAVASNRAGSATVHFYRNKFKVREEQVELRVGRNLFALDRLRLEEGFHEFECRVDAPDGADTRLENNVARGVVRVSGRPKVLLVEREEREARYLEEALSGEEIEVEVRPAAGLPTELNDLLNYDVLMLSDVPANEFQPGAMEAVKTYVREMGGGLVMLGGEQSFGLGGYYRTPIEDVLPVKMPIKKNVEKPNLALVLVIDKSGSMGGTKMDLAKEAAIASAEVLKGNDRFGVVAFDARAEWITPMTHSSETATIVSTIARLMAGGGTNIYPALQEAWQALRDEDAKLKHIILLSDGQTQGSGYDNLVNHISADGITISTVGIGDGADERLLTMIATRAGGEYYFTNDFGTIPQILTRETMRASKSMLVEVPFVPTSTGPADALKGIDPDELPFLFGYVATQKKDLATVALASDFGDPVLALWNYGLGRSVAFTSDAKARWAGDWVTWEGFGKFWGQLVRSVMSTGAHEELRPRTRIDVDQGRARVTVDVRDRLGAYRDDVQPTISLLQDTDGAPLDLDVEHLGPGLYVATFPIEDYGQFYRLLVVHRRGDDVVDMKAVGVTESYSPEFRTPVPNEELMRLVAQETNGTFAPTAEDVWTFEGDPARTPRDTWWWWLVAASILLPLDIALRRLGA